jgi:hypothetical protein
MKNSEITNSIIGISRSLNWMILPLMVLFTGCTGFNQAYEERVCWEKGLPIECNVHAITLSCPELPLFIKPSRSSSFTKVFIEPIDGPANPKVGYLFSQNGDKPIYLIGKAAWETLQKDLETILHSYGLKIIADKNDSDAVIQGNMTLLDVRSKHGGWLDFKIPTKAQASFEVKIFDPDENLLWQQEFYGSNETMVSYAYLEGSKDLLDQAYCQALSEFVTAFESFNSRE